MQEIDKYKLKLEQYNQIKHELELECYRGKETDYRVWISPFVL